MEKLLRTYEYVRFVKKEPLPNEICLIRGSKPGTRLLVQTWDHMNYILNVVNLCRFVFFLLSHSR